MPDIISKLPVELVSEVLQHPSAEGLCALSGVNKRFKALVYPVIYKSPKISTKGQLDSFVTISKYAQSCVQNLDFSAVCSDVSSDIFTDKLQNLCSLKDINLSKCHNLTCESILALLKDNVNSLESLNLYGCRFDDDVLKCIGEAVYKRLTRLNLKSTMSFPYHYCGGYNDLSSALSSSAKLKYLDVSGCFWVTMKTVETIVKTLPLLQELNLSWCRDLEFSDTLVCVSQMPSLIYLNVNFVKIFFIDFYERFEERDPEIMAQVLGPSLKKIFYTEGSTPKEFIR